jgi:hypothetical protein
LIRLALLLIISVKKTGCVSKFSTHVKITKTGYCISRRVLIFLEVFIKSANEIKINFSASSDFCSIFFLDKLFLKIKSLVNPNSDNHIQMAKHFILNIVSGIGRGVNEILL